MIATAHMIIGGGIGLAVGLATHNPALALAAGIASHLVCDAIPHMDHPPGIPKKGDDLIWTSTLWIFAFADSGIAWIVTLLLAYYRFYPHSTEVYFLLGAIGGYLPDFIDNVPFWNGLRNLPGFKQFHSFHDAIHQFWNKRFPMPQYAVLGILSQVLVVGLSLFYLLHH
jgi:hypothetical protein